MTIKKLITVPDEVLRKKSQNIQKVGENEKKLIKDLFETMYHHKGIGLAAIQVGIPQRVIVLDVTQKENQKNPLCFINPIIKNSSNAKSKYEEGCLSIPNTFIEIERPKKCLVEYVDIEGKKKKYGV